MTSEDTGFSGSDPVATRLTEALANVDREPISLHAALRRVIVTNADPDTAAHRARGVLARWLSKQGREMRVSGDMFAEGAAIAELAEELEAGTATAAEADAEIARLREQVATVRADERQRCVAWLRQQASRTDGASHVADAGAAEHFADELEAGASAPAATEV